MTDTVKVRFKTKAYLPDPANPANTILFMPVDQLPEGNDGIYTFPADYALPTEGVEIVEGKSTYKKPADAAPAPTTQINPAVKVEGDKKTATRKRTAEK